MQLLPAVLVTTIILIIKQLINHKFLTSPAISYIKIRGLMPWRAGSMRSSSVQRDRKVKEGGRLGLETEVSYQTLLPQFLIFFSHQGG